MIKIKIRRKILTALSVIENKLLEELNEMHDKNVFAPAGKMICRTLDGLAQKGVFAYYRIYLKGKYYDAKARVSGSRLWGGAVRSADLLEIWTMTDEHGKYRWLHHARKEVYIPCGECWDEFMIKDTRMKHSKLPNSIAGPIDRLESNLARFFDHLIFKNKFGKVFRTIKHFINENALDENAYQLDWQGYLTVAPPKKVPRLVRVSLLTPLGFGHKLNYKLNGELKCLSSWHAIHRRTGQKIAFPVIAVTPCPQCMGTGKSGMLGLR